jgi:kynurenine formamidase
VTAPEQSVAKDAVLEAVRAGVRTYDLGRPLFDGLPQSSAHPSFRMVVPRRHGDLVRADGSSAANDLIVTGTHVGTHIDALSHISFEGRLHGGIEVSDVQSQFGFSQLGVETVEPIVARAVLLDIPRALGIASCLPAYEVSVADLERAADLAGVTPERGDVILVRTGWGSYFDDPELYAAEQTGAPGPSEAGARWLAAQAPLAVGADTVAFERIPASDPNFVLSAHRVLIYENGIYIIEVLNLEELAADGVSEFTFVLSPLKLRGATGSPVRPIGLVPLDVLR